MPERDDQKPRGDQPREQGRQPRYPAGRRSYVDRAMRPDQRPDADPRTQGAGRYPTK